MVSAGAAVGRQSPNDDERAGVAMRAQLMKQAGLYVLTAVLSAVQAQAQDACPNRGQLDALYCDADKDLVADAPTDPAKWKDPSTLVWAYTVAR